MWDFVYTMGCLVGLCPGFLTNMCSNNDASGTHDCERNGLVLTAPHISNSILNVTTFNNKCQILLINATLYVSID